MRRHGTFTIRKRFVPPLYYLDPNSIPAGNLRHKMASNEIPMGMENLSFVFMRRLETVFMGLQFEAAAVNKNRIPFPQGISFYIPVNQPRVRPQGKNLSFSLVIPIKVRTFASGKSYTTSSL